jgi:hypothetical protein
MKPLSNLLDDPKARENGSKNPGGVNLNTMCKEGFLVIFESRPEGSEQVGTAERREVKTPGSMLNRGVGIAGKKTGNRLQNTVKTLHYLHHLPRHFTNCFYIN